MRCAAATTLVLLLAAGESAGQPPGPPGEPVWATRLADGYARARRLGRPVFVRVGSASCPWCRKLEAELRDPAVAKELDRWALVELDVSGAEKDARALGVGPVPALRVLTASGRVVAGRDGFMPAAELVEWLGKHHAAAASGS